jgi:hypothetical protein
VPARLVAQQPPHGVDAVAAARVLAPGISGAPPVTIRNGSPAV